MWVSRSDYPRDYCDFEAGNKKQDATSIQSDTRMIISAIYQEYKFAGYNNI